MIACAAKVTIVRRSLLFAMGRADAAVHVENDHLRWTTVMNLVDPRPVHVGQGFNVHIACQKLRLEALSANITETPAPLGITVGRWR